MCGVRSDVVTNSRATRYQPGSPYAGTAVGTASNVNIFLNTLVFKNAPTGVMMLHAIKPTTNLESLGYGWTWWRSTGSNASAAFPDLEPNHFVYNFWNWYVLHTFAVWPDPQKKRRRRSARSLRWLTSVTRARVETERGVSSRARATPAAFVLM